MGEGERGVGRAAGTAGDEAVVGTGSLPVRDPTPPPGSGVVGRGAQDVARLAAASALPQAEPVLQIPLPRIAPRVRSRTALARGVAFSGCRRIVVSCSHLVVHERISGSDRLFQTAY